MAVDIKIELFSVDLFRNLWFKNRLLEFIPPRMKKYTGQKSENSSEAVHAVWCRQQIFHQSLFKKIWDDYDLFSRSGVDFYLYIQNHALEFISYQLNVFDRLFMTCAFVLEMSCCSAFNANKDYLYAAPLSWAMFFDYEMKAEFYFEGGWEIFKKYANSYSANILTYPWMIHTCVHSEDYENVKLLFQSASEFYNFSEIFRTFAVRYEKRKCKVAMACPKCAPMFLVLRDIVYPGAQSSERGVLIEGYLQIILRMLSDEEIALRRDEFLDSMRSGGSSSETEGSSDQNFDGKHSANASSEGGGGTQSMLTAEIIEEAFISVTTSELVDRLFVDEADVESKCGFEPCIFCGRIVVSNKLSSTEKFSIHVERIKSAISKVRDVEAENGAVGGRSAVRSASDVDEVMRLFLFLGLEPMHSQTLSVLKRNSRTKPKQETNKDVEEACDAFSFFKLNDDSPNKKAKNKSKRKRSNKK